MNTLLNKQTGEPRRHKPFQVLMTDVEYDRLNILSRKVGVSMGECVRRMIDRTQPEQLANKEG